MEKKKKQTKKPKEGVIFPYVALKARFIYSCPIAPGVRLKPPPEVVGEVRRECVSVSINLFTISPFHTYSLYS